MDKFVNLHVHSTYSFLDGLGMPNQYATKAKELGQIALGVTDHGNISSHYKWYKSCTKERIKPILGCELYVKSEELDWKKYHHITVLALNNVGYKNLLQLVTEGWQAQAKHPVISMERIVSLSEGLLVTSGCPSGKIVSLIASGRKEEAEHELLYLNKNIKNFYIEVSPWDFKGKNGYQYSKAIIEMKTLSERLNIPMLATSDCHYVEKEHSNAHEILLCIQMNDTMDNPNRWKFDQNDFYLKTRKDMEDSFFKLTPGLDLSEALDNTVKVSDMVDFEFPKASPLRLPMGENKKRDLLLKMCQIGLKEKGLENNAKYVERMDYECKLVFDKNFVDYFLIVTDMVQWAKRNEILVGPARGSSAGSLICFLLRITEVDPLIHDLMFERFIDINREDLPDIDIDFEDDRRGDVIKYLESKYGSDKVCQISTFATFKGKNTIQDFGRVFRNSVNIDANKQWNLDISMLSSLIIERSGGDSRSSFTIMDTFEQFESAKKILSHHPYLKYASVLEGQLKNLGAHASGIVVSNDPLTNFCAIYKTKEDGRNTSSLDYDDASKLGLVKIDVLGLNTLSCISKALKMIKDRHKRDIDIYNLPLDNPKVYAGFKDEKKLFGVFQFDGQSMNQVCRQMLPEKFEELSAINALSRPGPMHGLDLELQQPITSIYIARKWGKLPMGYAHPLLKPITEETQGVVIYQEQVMKVMREIGKMTWKDTAEIRKLISRSQGVERFNDFKIKFSLGAKENGLTDSEIDNIWSAICTFGSWSFNKSHSVSYSIISYWTMWLKIYYPIEYYCAMTSTMNSEDKIKRIIKEYKREGLELLPVDINKSKASFSIDSNNLRIGFSQIKGISEIAGKTIEEFQPYENIDDFKSKMEKKHHYSKSVATEKYIKLLHKMGAFDSIGGANKSVSTLFGIEKESKYEPMNGFEEKILLCPYSVEFNIYDTWKEFIQKYIKSPVEKIEHLDSSKGSQTIIGIVYDKNLKDKIEEAVTRGKPIPIVEAGFEKYCNFILEDDSDFVTIRVYNRNFPSFKKLIFEDLTPGDIVMVKGKMGDGIRMFFANEIICLNHFKSKIERKAKRSEYSESELVLSGVTQREYKPRFPNNTV